MTTILKESDFIKHEFVKVSETSTTVTYEKRFPTKTYILGYHKPSDQLNLRLRIFESESDCNRFYGDGDQAPPFKHDIKVVFSLRVHDPCDLTFLLRRDEAYQQSCYGKSFRPYLNKWTKGGPIEIEKETAPIHDDLFVLEIN